MFGVRIGRYCFLRSIVDKTIIYIYRMDYRNPRVIDELLNNTSNYNVFFVCSHGTLVPNSVGGQFSPSEKSILIYTGAGKSGFPITTNKRIEKTIMDLFNPSTIQSTFAAFLGLYEGLPELLYKVPTEKSPEIHLSMSEEDRVRDIGFYGVYKHVGVDSGRRNFHTIEEIPELTKQLFDGIFASSLVHMIEQKYLKQGKTNIIVFISCRNATKYKGTRGSNYSESSAPFFENTHFMSQHVPSGLNHAVPIEMVEPFRDQSILLAFQSGVHIPLLPTERNILVSDLISLLRTKHGIFTDPSIKGVWTTDTDGMYRPLANDVLLESQLHTSILRLDSEGQYILPLHPRYLPENVDHSEDFTGNPSGFFHPKNLETVEAIRRGKLTKKRKYRKR